MSPSPSTSPKPPLTPRGPRHPPADGLEVSCSTAFGGPNIAVVLLNTSAEGVGLLVSEAVSKGADVFLTMRQPGGPETTRPATVRWCRRVYGEFCRIGLRFAAPKPAAPAPEPAKVTAADKQPSGERRGGNRRTAKGSARVVCRRGAVETAGDIALSLFDVSETGARLLVNQRLDPGSDVGLVFQVRGHTGAVQRRGIVRWCVRTDNWSYCVGVELSERMTAADLHVLA